MLAFYLPGILEPGYGEDARPYGSLEVHNLSLAFSI